MRRTEKSIEAMITRENGEEWFSIATACAPGQTVADGYGERKAPATPGEWDLYQIARDNQHVRFVWLNELDERNKLIGKTYSDPEGEWEVVSLEEVEHFLNSTPENW